MKPANDELTANPEDGLGQNHTAEILSKLGIEDSLVQQLITLLDAQDRSTSGQSAHEEAPHNLDRQSQTVRQLKRENQLLRRSNEYMLEQSQMLASAIGACPDCWGEDPDCTECGGEGKPGTFMPHRGCFEVFVLPVVDALRSDTATRRRKREEAARKVGTQDTQTAEDTDLSPSIDTTNEE